jgi:membrane protease YdiL (CAAX protease family)
MSNASSEPDKPESSYKSFWLRSKKINNGNFGSPLRIVLYTLLIFIISQLIAAFVVGAGLNIIHDSASLSNALENSAPAQFFYILLAEGLAILLVLWVIRGRGLPLAAIGLGRRPNKRDLKRGLGGFGAFFLLAIITTALLSFIFPDLNISQEQDVGFSNLPAWHDTLLAFLALVILPPLGEETLVRGYLYGGLRSSWRFMPAMLLTGLFFAAAHLQPGNEAGLVWGAAINTFLLSFVLVYLRERTGALYAGILVHGLNNVIAFVVHFHGVIF